MNIFSSPFDEFSFKDLHFRPPPAATEARQIPPSPSTEHPVPATAQTRGF